MTPGVMDIGAVSKHVGLPASTLRYYEEQGLIQSVGRNGLRRLFDRNVLESLAFIALGRKAGFSLDDIAEMLSKNKRHRVDRAKLVEKANDLDRKINELTAVRDGLRHAAECSAASHIECPTFQRFLNAAIKSQVRDHARKSRKKGMP